MNMKIDKQKLSIGVGGNVEEKLEEKLRDLWDNDRGLTLMSSEFQQER